MSRFPGHPGVGNPGPGFGAAPRMGHGEAP